MNVIVFTWWESSTFVVLFKVNSLKKIANRKIVIFTFCLHCQLTHYFLLTILH
jgi:hypothetical protein